MLQVEGEEPLQFVHTNLDSTDTQVACRASLHLDGRWTGHASRSDTCPGEPEPTTIISVAYNFPPEISAPGVYTLARGEGGGVRLDLYDDDRRRIRVFTSRDPSTMVLEIDDIRPQVGGRAVGRFRTDVVDRQSPGGPHNAVIMVEFDVVFGLF